MIVTPAVIQQLRNDMNRLFAEAVANPTVRIISVSDTALTTDDTIICDTALTLTIPTAVGVEGKFYNIKSTAAGIVEVVSDTSIYLFADECLTLQSDGTNWLII